MEDTRTGGHEGWNRKCKRANAAVPRAKVQKFSESG
jgi:hypothetical protein